MRISMRGRYGLRAMVDLAQNSNESHVPLSSIAMRQNISETYLEQLFSALKKSGLIRSIRGAQGGYMLTKSPHDVTVGEVLRSLEGELVPVECANKGAEKRCDSSNNCASRIVWKKLNESINTVIDSMTLGDLIEEVDLIED